MADEPALDGSRVRRLRLFEDGKWIELLATTCGPAGVMLQQTFSAVDAQGHSVTGHLTQTDIRIGPLPESLRAAGRRGYQAELAQQDSWFHGA